MCGQLRLSWRASRKRERQAPDHLPIDVHSGESNNPLECAGSRTFLPLFLLHSPLSFFERFSAEIKMYHAVHHGTHPPSKTPATFVRVRHSESRHQRTRIEDAKALSDTPNKMLTPLQPSERPDIHKAYPSGSLDRLVSHGKLQLVDIAGPVKVHRLSSLELGKKARRGGYPLRAC